jgi:hypothetical protein
MIIISYHSIFSFFPIQLQKFILISLLQIVHSPFWLNFFNTTVNTWDPVILQLSCSQCQRRLSTAELSLSYRNHQPVRYSDTEHCGHNVPTAPNILSIARDNWIVVGQ